MPTTVELLLRGLIDESQIHLMHQGRCLQRFSGLLAGQLGGGKLSQLFIDQRQQSIRGPRIALHFAQDARDVRHAAQCTETASGNHFFEIPSATTRFFARFSARFAIRQLEALARFGGALNPALNCSTFAAHLALENRSS